MGEKYICLLPAQACEETTAAEPAAPLETTNPAANPAPVEVLAKPSEDSCARNNCKELQETDSTDVPVCLVRFLKCVFSFMWSYLTSVDQVWELRAWLPVDTSLSLQT